MFCQSSFCFTLYSFHWAIHFFVLIFFLVCFKLLLIIAFCIRLATHISNWIKLTQMCSNWLISVNHTLCYIRFWLLYRWQSIYEQKKKFDESLLSTFGSKKIFFEDVFPKKLKEIKKKNCMKLALQTKLSDEGKITMKNCVSPIDICILFAHIFFSFTLIVTYK